MLKKIILPFAVAILFSSPLTLASDNEVSIMHDDTQSIGKLLYIGQKTISEVAEELINELIAEGDIVGEIWVAQDGKKIEDHPS